MVRDRLHCVWEKKSAFEDEQVVGLGCLPSRYQSAIDCACSELTASELYRAASRSIAVKKFESEPDAAVA